MLSSASGDVGTVTATQISAEQTTLEITLVGETQPHAWGIYDQSTCDRPQPDHDAPFQFADIEGGSRVEELETQPYLTYPSNLVVLVFTLDGGEVYGCLNLGGPLELATPGPSERCAAPAAPASQLPNGSEQDELAFSKELLGNADIYRASATGQDELRLTTALGPDTKPTWSPDGSRIAFRTGREGQDEIYVMNADGTCERNLTVSPSDDRSPAWSPDGCQIAFDHFFNPEFQDVAVIDPRGGPLRRVSSHSGEYPAWSPDGQRIAFASARDGDYDIYIIDIDGKNERKVANLAGYQMYPAWSPDGEWLAYQSGPDTIDGQQIHLIHPDGSGEHAITDAQAITNQFPAWSSQGRLAWSASGTLMILDQVGETAREIGDGQFPAWRSWTSVATATC